MSENPTDPISPPNLCETHDDEEMIEGAGGSSGSGDPMIQKSEDDKDAVPGRRDRAEGTACTQSTVAC